MFEHMKIADQVYEEGLPSQTTTRADFGRASHVRKYKGGESFSPTKPKKGRSGKRKKNHSGHQSDHPTGENMIGAFPWELYKGAQINQGILQEVRHTAATQRQRSPL